MIDGTPDDMSDVIASLLTEAAELSAAATAKLEEALRLAEQAKGEKLEGPPMTEDWQFFRENPTRHYHARLATPAELDRIEEEQGAFIGRALRSDNFAFCLCRVWRDISPCAMRQLFVAIPRLEDCESECQAAWPAKGDTLLFARDAWQFL
jgi:hypothetical protein